MSVHDLSQAMKRRRHELGLNVAQASQAGNVSRSTWNEIEAEQRNHVTAPVLAKIDVAMQWSPGTAWAHYDGIAPSPPVPAPARRKPKIADSPAAVDVALLVARVEALEQDMKLLKQLILRAM